MKTRLACLGVAGLMLVPQISFADPVADFYKGKTVKVVIGASMGGSYGLFAQFLSRHIPKHLAGAPTVVVQSMPGSGGNKAMNYAFNAGAQDGSMVSMPQMGMVLESLFNPKARFDARKNQYIGRFTNINIVGTVHKRAGMKSWEDAKTKVYNFGTIGRRNVTYLGVAIFNLMAGTKFKVISGYRGTKASYLAKDRGELDLAATSWMTLNVSHAEDLKNGTYIPIFQMSRERQPDLPNVPTITEFGRTKGGKAFVAITASGGDVGRSLMAPPKMPKYLVAAWNKAFAATMADPVFIANVAKRKASLNTLTGAQLSKAVNDVMNLPKADIKGAFEVYTTLLKAKY